MSKKLTGSFVALITPFNKDGSVDFSAFRALLKFQADHRTSAVLIMGSTGETSTASFTSRCVLSPSRISPGAAACSSRAATFTASPVTRR